MEHCLTMYLVVKFCISEVRLSKRWNGSTTASTWWITADKSLLYFWREWNLPLAPIFICCITIVPLWIETRTAYKWVINVRTLLYAVCLFIYIFVSRSFPLPSAVLSTGLKGERFSGWILFKEGRFTPKRLAARPFNFQMKSVLPLQTSNGNGWLAESGNS